MFIVMSGVSYAQKKPRMAIIDFSVDGVSKYWRGSEYKIGKAAVDIFITELVQAGKITMVERQQLAAVMKEQNLGTMVPGRLDPSTVSQIGKILGVRYIMTGRITQFAEKQIGGRTGGLFKKLGGLSGKKKTLEGRMDIRVMDTVTAEIVLAEKGNHKKSNYKFGYRGTGGGTDFDQTAVNDVFEPIIEKLALALNTRLPELAKKGAKSARRNLSGKIIKLKGNQVYINLGANSGIAVGDAFNVFEVEDELIDPDTGESLGAEESKVGSLVITKVSKKYSIGTKSGKAKKGHKVRLQ